MAAESVGVKVSGLVVRYEQVTAVNGISFAAAPGEFITLLGPSGCGKTTALRAIAGLERPAAGEIWVGDRLVFSAERRVNLPPEKRHVSMVFQSYAVWPHLSVFENVAYPLRVRRLPEKEVRERVFQALELVGLADLARRNVTQLSGGQQQRVALARAVVFSPAALLLDEPLSNLDARLRARMRVEIRELQRNLRVTTVYVTHDQEEALAISDRVVVMNAGVIEQVGTPADIYDRPRNSFVANFIGSANLIEGAFAPELSRNGLAAFRTASGLIVYAAGSAPGWSDGLVAVRPTYIVLGRICPPGEVNVWRGRVVRRLFAGDFVEYFVRVGEVELNVRRPPGERFSEGEEVFVSVDPQHCVVVER